VCMDGSQLMALLVDAKSAVRSVRCTGVSRARDVPPGADEWESTWTIWHTSEGRYRIERAKGITCFDGSTCWTVLPDGAKAFKSPTPLPSLLDDAISPGWLHPDVNLVDLGETVIEGRSCRSVDARTSDGELHYSLTVDQGTGLILKSRDERTGRELELHDVAVNVDIDESRFRPELGPNVTVVEPPSRMNILAVLARFAVRSVFRRHTR
jgi:outer membrane lipoprotein-sorting protein